VSVPLTLAALDRVTVLGGTAAPSGGPAAGPFLHEWVCTVVDKLTHQWDHEAVLPGLPG
jgi:hypothetical protein